MYVLVTPVSSTNKFFLLQKSTPDLLVLESYHRQHKYRNPEHYKKIASVPDCSHARRGKYEVAKLWWAVCGEEEGVMGRKARGEGERGVE